MTAALPAEIRRVVAQALDEDLGRDGDVTSAACVPAQVSGVGTVVAREEGVVFGLAVLPVTFAGVDERVRVEAVVDDGAAVAAGTVLARVRGPLAGILTAERTALNLLGHLSGIATLTRRFAGAVHGTGCVIRDTRKTTPGLRVLEKAAVRAGGGRNHRMGLHDALLVKDNHVVAAGGMAQAVRAALRAAGGRPVQVEVTNLEELATAVEEGATDILLDNLPPGTVREAVRRYGRQAHLEASGRIGLDRVRAYAEAGVDSVAVGALTHSARWLDVALDAVVAPPQQQREEC